MNYHNITKDDMLNGDGLRVVLWVAGCTHNCFGCHNPQTHDPNSGILFDEAAKAELFAELSKDYISGITFSGGDPLHESNCNTILNLILEIRKNYPEKTIWLYTGYTFSQIENGNNSIRKKIIENIDVLVDGQFVKALADINYAWAGSTNQKVIRLTKSSSR